MKKIFFAVVSMCSMLVGIQVNALGFKDDISMYPEAKEGFERKVITLDKLENEENYKVELFVGKTTTIDACNRFGLNGNWVTKDVNGWGYSYFEFQSNGDIFSTLIGCLDSSLKTQIVYGTGNFISYNSKLPIVVYTPIGMDLQYKVWETDGNFTSSIKK